MKTFLNEKPFSHITRNGIMFACDRCDLRGPIHVSKFSTNQQLALAVIEMINDRIFGFTSMSF